MAPITSSSSRSGLIFQHVKFNSGLLQLQTAQPWSSKFNIPFRTSLALTIFTSYSCYSCKRIPLQASLQAISWAFAQVHSVLSKPLRRADPNFPVCTMLTDNLLHFLYFIYIYWTPSGPVIILDHVLRGHQAPDRLRARPYQVSEAPELEKNPRSTGKARRSQALP